MSEKKISMRASRRGAVSWMAQNPVASNLLMIVLIVGGLLVGSQVKQEVFPEFELDMVSVQVPYPGASPSEVETGIILAVEEQIRGLDGIKKVDATAAEGYGVVMTELILGADGAKVAADIKNAVDRIQSFPDDAERPIVSLVTNRNQVISLVLYGDSSEETLKQLAERARLELLNNPSITLIELSGVRNREISIEVPQSSLRSFGLTLNDVAQEVARSSVELPGGALKTSAGEVLLRMSDRKDLGSEFAGIRMVSSADGTTVHLGDIAQVKDGFEDDDRSDRYNGKPAVMINVFRIGDQTPIEIADIVKDYAQHLGPSLPEGIAAGVVNDRSQMYRDRLALLLNNAYLGLALVLITLGLFLEIRLAFWVTMGIPISFMGSLLLMPAMNVSINMISLFAFIVTLGMVVDDAIVVGENVFEARQKGIPPLQAAIQGTKEVGIPVVFSVTTTMVAFMPLFFIPGTTGKFFRVIPTIVVLVLFISLIESIFVLPAHLAHLSERPPGMLRQLALRIQAKVSTGLTWVIERTYSPTLRFALSNRYLTIAIAIAVLLASAGYVAGGRIDFTFMPKVDSDQVAANATLPFGSAVEETERVNKRLLETAREIIAEHGGDAIVDGVYAGIGTHAVRGGPRGGTSVVQGNLTHVQVYMVPSDQREITASEFARAWREKTKDLVGLEQLSFRYSTGPSDAPALDVQLRHEKLGVLELAAADLAERLRAYEGMRDIDDGFSSGKPQLDMTITAAAESLGLTAAEIGRQVRSAFYGAEAVRQQRGRDEIRVMVRLPEAERESEQTIENLLIRAPNGGEIPLKEAAQIHRGQSYTAIMRTDGRRVVDVTADVSPGAASVQKIKGDLIGTVLPELAEKYPGLTYGFEGQNRRQDETLGALQSGFMMAMLAIFALLAIPFKSYAQPLVVMSAIPFGMVGALIGHLIMGFNLSIISMMGIVALTGVVVNDSLVLVDAANRARSDSGLSAREAIDWAGKRRFRPILLTSLTTFLGLTPMILETSVQARFLIPMAISLGFGVLFATFITLLLVPTLYLILEDIKAALGIGVRQPTRRVINEPKELPTAPQA